MTDDIYENVKNEVNHDDFLSLNRRDYLKTAAAGSVAAMAGCEAPKANDSTPENQSTSSSDRSESSRIAADPEDIPAPISYDEPKHHQITMTVEEVTAEIEDGVTFDYMTFDGQVPGPMLRARRGDTIELTLENPKDNNFPHNVDLHAVYGPGGGAADTTVAPGESETIEFSCEYPGAFVYHCAVPNLDMHISSGMYGMILVEPEEGLPEVDHEFYFGQHELYTDKERGEEGKHSFDMEAMEDEEPTYTVMNGEKHAITEGNYGAPDVEVGDTARVYMASGGPNQSSSFHPIGNVWTKSYANGALASDPDEYVQTEDVPPGSAFVGELEFPVPETIKLVDHALTRAAKEGAMAEIDVNGEQDQEIYNPDP